MWTRVEERVDRPALASTWAWTESWLEHYGDVVPHDFVLAERAHEPRGIALVTRTTVRHGPVPVRQLHLGTAGEPTGEGVHVEYNGLLVRAGEERTFATELIALLEHDRRWDELVLDGFGAPEARWLLEACPRLEPSYGASPFTDLSSAGGGRGDVVALLPRGTRKRIQRSLRGFGSIEVEWAESTEHALEILAELARLHQRRWTGAGQPGVFASDRFTGFHRSLVRRLVPSGRVVLFRARSEDGTVGCLYGFVDRGRLLFYQSGLAPVADNKLKPGLVAHALCMQAAADRGLRAYDFLGGQSRYKDELSTGTNVLVSARMRRPRARWGLIGGLRGARRAARRLQAHRGLRPSAAE